MRKSVVHVVVAGEVGGAERMLVDLAKDTRSREHSVALFTPNERLRALFRDASIAVHDRGPVREGPLPYLVRTLGPADTSWLTRILRSKNAGIVHLHTFASQVLGTRAARRHGARIVRTEHSTRVYDDPTCWPFSRWSLKRADAAVCISAHVHEVALARAPWAKRKLSVVPNGVDTARFAPAPLAYLSPNEHVRFVALGRLEPRKGFDIAVEALARVERADLTIVGEGEERSRLEQLARRLGVENRVHFAGFASDVRAHVARGHLGLSSSRSEGLGIALLETMATGRAVVALPTGGIPEIVDDGSTGWLAKGHGPAALASVMNAAIEAPDEIPRRAALARARVAEKFSVDAMRASYERLYETLD